VRQYNQDYEEGVRRFNEEMARLKALDEANEAIIEDTPEEETKASGYTGRFLTIPGMTAGNKEITDFIEKNMPKAVSGSYSASSYQQKLANDEKKLQGAGADKNNEPEKYEFGTPYYRGSYNSDVKQFGTFNNGYQPKGINGHGWLKKTGEKEEVHTIVQYGKDAGKEKVVHQNIWVADDGTKWIWNGVANEYEEY